MKDCVVLNERETLSNKEIRWAAMHDLNPERWGAFEGRQKLVIYASEP